MISCFLTGCQTVREGLQEQLTELVERHAAQHGVTKFIVGRQGEFDYLAASVVKEVRRRRPQVELHLFRPSASPARTPRGFDGVVCPVGPHPARHVAESSDFVIVYAPDRRELEELTAYTVTGQDHGEPPRVSVL